jgi:hypothetical protein
MLSMATLHVLNGDAAREVFDRAGIQGERLVWADLLHEGPLPVDLGTAEVRRIRAEYLFAAGHGDRAALTEKLLAQDDGLGRWYDFDQVVFWLEHDLYDQLLMIRHLAWLSEHVSAQARSRLVVADRYLGRSAPADLTALFETRRPVNETTIAAGKAAWRAVTADDPERVIALVDAGPSADLPFLHGALARWLQEYPSVENGLSRSERQLLTAVADGCDTLETCFAATQAMEDREFLGDAAYLTIARKLGEAQDPLIMLTSMSGGGLLNWRVALTRCGRDVMAGEADHVHANGLERWVGGVYLSGFGPSWRWTGTTVTWSDWQGTH